MKTRTFNIQALSAGFFLVAVSLTMLLRVYPLHSSTAVKHPQGQAQTSLPMTENSLSVTQLPTIVVHPSAEDIAAAMKDSEAGIAKPSNPLSINTSHNFSRTLAFTLPKYR